jgi:cytochrome d ubiquinol oxidase subunit II
MDLPLLFALVAAFGIAAYVLADGFDLGIGILFLLAPRDADRDTMMESIAPFWDGNETWLVLGGSLLFAAFPVAYFILLPAFYLPIMLMLFSLILRGVSFEFRFQAGRFRLGWDCAFAAGSVMATLAQGFVLGGFIQGVTVENGVFAGGTFDFLSILGVLCGAGLLGGYALLGAGWLIWRTEGGTQTFGREVGHAALILTGAMMLLVSAWTAVTQPEVSVRWFIWTHILPVSRLPIASVGVVVLLWRSLWGGRDVVPFLLGIVLFLLGFAGLGVSLFPYVVPRHYTVWTGSADPASLRFVAVGMMVILPIIVGYLGHTYWVFRGKMSGLEGHGVQEATGYGGRPTPAIVTELHLS